MSLHQVSYYCVATSGDFMLTKQAGPYPGTFGFHTLNSAKKMKPALPKIFP